MIKFALPGMYEHYKVLIPLCSLIKIHPEYFYDNIEIGAVFGNFQFSCWDGGRIFFIDDYKHATREDIERLKYIYNQELNIPIRLIFTSVITDKTICNSFFDNMVAHLCEDPMNEIVVASGILEEYLRATYPQYSFISSTTKCIKNPNEAKEELLNPNFKMSCIDYNLNKNKEFLDSIPMDKRNKVEFLVNAICPPGCPSRKLHYKLNSQFNFSYGASYNVGVCGIQKNHLYPWNYKNNFTFNEIIEYHKNGFENFKLEGRTFDDKTTILTVVPYLVKPEYQLYIIDFLLHIIDTFDLNNFSLEQFKNIRI